METLFDWSKPEICNNLDYYIERYFELKLSTYINEFELIVGSFIEKSVNTYLQLPNIINISKIIIKELVKKVEVGWICLKSIMDEFGNTS